MPIPLIPLIAALAGTPAVCPDDSLAPTPRYEQTSDSTLTRLNFRACNIPLDRQEFFVNAKGDTVPQGVRIWYHPNGVVGSELTFLRGRKWGPARRFDEKGRLMWEAHYRQDRLDSLERNWDPSTGILRSSLTWRWDKQDGPAKYWDSKGRLTGYSLWKDGLLAGDSITLHADSTVATQRPYGNGVAEGIEKHFDDLGVQVYSLRWKKGRREGEERLWWGKDRPQRISLWKNDTLHGWEVAYDQRGLLEGRRLWLKGRKVQEYLPPPPPPPPMPEEAFALLDAPEFPPEDPHQLIEMVHPERPSEPTTNAPTLSAIVPPALPATGPVDSTVQSGDTVRVFDKAGRLRSETVIVDGKWQGTHSLWRQGRLFVTLDFRNDTLEGMARMYHGNGRPSQEIPYQRGRIEGPVRELRADGTVSAEYNYRDDKRHGPSKGWNANGGLRFELSYVEGQKDGPHRTWYPSGKMRSLTEWYKGALNGQKVVYSEAGKPLTTSRYAYDVCMEGDCDLEAGKGSPFDVE